MLDSMLVFTIIFLHKVYDIMSREVTTFDNSGGFIFDKSLDAYSYSKLLAFLTDEQIKDMKYNRKSIEIFHNTLNKLNSHDAKSLLYIKNFLLDKKWENIALDKDDYKNLLIDHLKSCTNPIESLNDLIRYKIENHVPEEYLEWFKNDLRCSLFLAHLVIESIEDNSYKGRDELLKGITDYLRYDIHMFNFYYYPNLPHYLYKSDRLGEWKTVHLLNVKSMYLKNRTEDKTLKWIDRYNEEQINWIYKYLSKKSNQYILLKGVFFPESTEEKYELILASLDVLSNVESVTTGTKNRKGFSLRKYVLFSMKNAWDGKQLYSTKTCSSDELNVKIYKKNIERLKFLLEKNDLNANKFINKLIEESYELANSIVIENNNISNDDRLENSQLSVDNIDLNNRSPVDRLNKTQTTTYLDKPNNTGYENDVDSCKKWDNVNIIIRKKKMFV